MRGFMARRRETQYMGAFDREGASIVVRGNEVMQALARPDEDRAGAIRKQIVRIDLTRHFHPLDNPAISPNHEAVSFSAHITDGTSNTLFGNSSTVQLPILQLAGFCDGSVRPVEGHDRSPFNLHFRQAEFFSNLNAVDPNNPNNRTWSGLISFFRIRISAKFGIIQRGFAGLECRPAMPLIKI